MVCLVKILLGKTQLRNQIQAKGKEYIPHLTFSYSTSLDEQRFTCSKLVFLLVLITCMLCSKGSGRHDRSRPSQGLAFLLFCFFERYKSFSRLGRLSERTFHKLGCCIFDLLFLSQQEFFIRTLSYKKQISCMIFLLLLFL